MGINWGADNNAVNDFMTVHAVEFPCASGLEGLGNEINVQYGIVSHITALVITPDHQIVGQFYAPYYPTRDTLNSLLLSFGAQMQSCSVGLSEESSSLERKNSLHVFPNPVNEAAQAHISIEEDGAYLMKIINNFGAIVQTIPLYLTKGENKIDLTFKSLSTGIYYISLQNNQEIMIKTKMLKK